MIFVELTFLGAIFSSLRFLLFWIDLVFRKARKLRIWKVDNHGKIHLGPSAAALIFINITDWFARFRMDADMSPNKWPGPKWICKGFLTFQILTFHILPFLNCFGSILLVLWLFFIVLGSSCICFDCFWEFLPSRFRKLISGSPKALTKEGHQCITKQHPGIPPSCHSSESY